jgi:hypothetical protein
LGDIGRYWEILGDIGDATLFLIGILFIPRLNVYAAGFLSGMIGRKGDLKQEILGALTAGFNAKVLHPTISPKKGGVPNIPVLLSMLTLTCIKHYSTLFDFGWVV